MFSIFERTITVIVPCYNVAPFLERFFNVIR
jgi:hypothetical protein